MDTVLSEMGALLRAMPAATTSAEDVATWYGRKAALFDRIAAEPDVMAAEPARAEAVARAARAHARRLRRDAITQHASPAA